MTRFCFSGCSLTYGEALNDTKENYASLVAGSQGAVLKNIAVPGNANNKIFMESMNELLFDTPDVLFVQWSELSRHWLYPALDLEFPITAGIRNDLKYLDFFLPQQQAKEFIDMFRYLNHDYHNILLLINYCKILELMAQDKCRLIFINGLIPWTPELRYPESVRDPHRYFSEYTKKLLCIDQLPDNDITKFFQAISTEIVKLDKSKWINMFSTIMAGAVDLATDNIHPGPVTHQNLANNIIKHLTK
jgi:hypothetical protein